MFRNYPPANVRSAAWYLACVALLAVPVSILLSSTVSQSPAGAIEAASGIGKLIVQAAGLIVAAGFLYIGFRFMYPIVLVLVVVFMGRAVMAPEPNLLGILVPFPVLLLLVTPTAVSWFLGRRRNVLPVAGGPQFHLPQR